MVTEILKHLSNKFSALAAYKSLKQSTSNGKTYITGLNQTGKLLVLAKIHQDTNKKIIYIVKNESEQAAIKQDLDQLAGDSVHTYPDLKSERINRKEYILDFQTRAESTATLKQKAPGIFIFPAKSLVEPLTSPSSALQIKVGHEYNPEEIIAKCIANGYERQTKVFQSGEIAMRGGVVDIFALGSGYPFRLEFGGNKLEKIWEFDPVSGTSQKTHAVVDIPALKSSKINEYLLEVIEENPKDFLIVFHQADELFQMLYELYQGNNSYRDNAVLTTVSKQLDTLPAWHFVSIPPTEDNLLRFDLIEAPLFANDLNRLAAEIKKYVQKSYQIIMVTEKSKQLTAVLEDHGITVGQTPTDSISVLTGKVPEGLMSASLKLILLTDKEIFSPITDQTHLTKKTPRRRQLAFLAGIEKGDYVVHADHGIGQLVEIGTMTVNDISREYLTIQYAGADKIYVPVDQIDKVSKYIAVAGEKPVLSRLSSQGWKRLVSRIKKESQEFAKELLDLYAKRALHQGIAFEGGEFWEKALADSFAFDETPDQEQVIRDILSDMERPKPMDRLLVADVGFGKTEVAVRAAFKAVTAGYQVAILAPTTILAEQHLKTFTERLSPFGTQVAALSRFRSTKEQQRIVVGLKTREVDVVVGTHRLLSADIKFANLGLIIIDEEQRFGVRHKEKLKLMRSEVDVLSLTATPIPRTLNLALSGIRDISTIETPPVNRLPIQTTVAPFDMGAVKDALLNEIKRGGQVYFVHNRVATIASITNKLKEVLPEVRFVYAHGQMPERLLAKIMEDFRQGKYDCLVASTIIENGLDNPNVNTLIVDNAGHFGLSQLHQLRGRIGRRKIQAYSYFYYSAGKLSGKALERLKTIAGHTELGSGYQIALRDLQIRGAGGVLSKRQHGHISAVGLTMYTKLLNRAIEELKTGYRPQVDTITVDLPISAYLPNSYIDNEAQRIKTYQQLALVEDEKEMKEALAELEEKFGEPPKEVQNLFELLKLKLLALETQKISSIVARNIAPSSKPVDYLCSILLTTLIKDKNIIGALENIGAKLSDNLIKLPLNAIGPDWIVGLRKVVNLLK